MPKKASITSETGSHRRALFEIVAKWLAIYSQTFPGYGESVKRAKCEAYAMTLDDIDPSILDEAMSRASRDCKRFPVPAEIREVAGAIEIERKAAATDERRKRLASCSRCDGLGFIPDPADPNTSQLCYCRSDRAKRSAARALLVEGPAEHEEPADDLAGEIADAAGRMSIQ